MQQRNFHIVKKNKDMKTKLNFYVLVIVLIVSVLSCKKEEVITPEKLFIGKWKIINSAKYTNGTGTPKYDLATVNAVQKYIFEITESKFSVIDITLNNKVYDETNYVFKDGMVWGELKYTTYLGINGEVVKVTFEGNNKMLTRASRGAGSDIYEFTYSRIQ
jgi:hypothetical protein